MKAKANRTKPSTEWGKISTTARTHHQYWIMLIIILSCEQAWKKLAKKTKKPRIDQVISEARKLYRKAQDGKKPEESFWYIWK